MKGADVIAALERDTLKTLKHLFPNGKVVNHDFCIGDITGKAGESLKVSLNGKGPVWADFNGGGKSGGGLLDLWAHARCGGAIGAAIAEAAAWLGLEDSESTPKQKWRPADVVYDYCNRDGKVIVKVHRWEATTTEKKRFAPQTLIDGKWVWKHPPKPRPLYGLADLAARPNAPVTLSEGEKAADGARDHLPGFVCMSWSGGVEHVRYADYAPLKGRRCFLWPDNDPKGKEAMQQAAELLTAAGAAEVRIVSVPEDAPPKFDLGDPLPKGWDENTIADLMARARANVQETASGPDWLKDCQSETNGRAIGNLANVALALRSDPAWNGLLSYDEMRRGVALKRAMPIIGAANRSNFPAAKPVHDADVAAAQEWLQLSGIRKLGRETVQDALDLVARAHPFHPLREWLEGLAWDGVERLDGLLIAYLGAEADDAGYAAAIGRMFLISMVARVMDPGCKVDYMPVLEGDQGTLKSTACKIIAGEPFFSDSMPGDVTNKDAALHLRGKWLVEMAEMHALTRSETTALKAFLTRTVDIYRPPYGRLEVHEPRQCVFIGTTNANHYLKDETGGRRFWPVKVGSIQPDRLARDRDQLFAEAVVAYRAGAHWWPDAQFEREHIAPQQIARYMADAWQEPIANYLNHESKVTLALVARGALNIQADRLDRTTQNRIAAVMRMLEWKPGPRTGKAQWWVSRVNE